MQSVVEVLRKGSGRDRLAVIADILSIFGVSIAAVVGGLLTLATELYVENIIAVAGFSLLSLALSTLILVGFLAVSGWLSRRCSYAGLFQFALWACCAALFVFAILAWYGYVRSFHYYK